VAAARASLTCGQVAELVAATSEPMSWERFRDNVTGAVERTSFRIPADPEMAEARFC
jgi:arabinofuranosyltransferase